jgi:hypothetical protein
LSDAHAGQAMPLADCATVFPSSDLSLKSKVVYEKAKNK